MQIAVGPVKGELIFDVPHDKPLKALHDGGSECNGTVVIEAGHLKLLWHRDDGGGLEAHWNDCSAQRDIEYFHENISQLFSEQSDPGAFRWLTLCRVLHTAAVDRHGTCSFGGGLIFLTIVPFCASNRA